MSLPSKPLPLHLHHSNPNPNLQFPFPNLKPSYSRPQTLRILCAKKSGRTGKQRYPSEKKRLKLKHKTLLDVDNKFEGFWRLSKLGVSVHKDPGKDFIGVYAALLDEIAKALEFPVASMLPPEAFRRIVRKSFDARKITGKIIIY
ncbi:hypothetical protein L1049_023181 [Liquidambar formosana]|uniref:Uncharacterized protein n=1 Tax=Liquidambar formosana TaxID=63359 RepID=A0AAP0RDM5_LIQFO